MKNEPFLEILSYCLVKTPYILLWVLLKKYLPSNCIFVLMTVQIQNLKHSETINDFLPDVFCFVLSTDQ